MSTHYDLVVIGSGFGSLFFLEGVLSRRPNLRVLVIERGAYHSVSWQVQNGRNSAISPTDTFATEDEKPWNFTIAVGGGTNCWYATTPRLHPSDFQVKSRYGIGRDWPVSYEELEPYYLAAEQRMSIAGSNELGAIFPRSGPYPLPPHVMTSVDKVMREAQPEWHFPVPTARASVATSERNRCCSSARCSLCPSNAKFNFENGFQKLLADPRITLLTGCEVRTLEHKAGVVTGARYLSGGREQRATGDLFVLGANGIHSPAILLRSGMDHPGTGRGLHEQIGYAVEVKLRGLDNFDGSTITTGLNYMLYDGDFRKDHANAVVMFENRWVFGLRKEPGRWRQSAPLSVVLEDLPQDDNRVTVDGEGRVHVAHRKVSDYGQRGVDWSFAQLPKVLAPLPVEDIQFKGIRPTESHVQGTLHMGDDPATSVVDGGQIHHKYRNLVVVGSSVFPTCGAGAPSLTVSALSLRCADKLF